MTDRSATHQTRHEQEREYDPQNPDATTCPVDDCDGTLSRSYSYGGPNRREQVSVCPRCHIGAVCLLDVQGEHRERTLKRLNRNKKKIGDGSGVMFPSPQHVSSMAAVIDGDFPAGQYRVRRVGSKTATVDMSKHCSAEDVAEYVTAWYDDGDQTDIIAVDDITRWYSPDEGRSQGFTVTLRETSAAP